MSAALHPNQPAIFMLTAHREAIVVGRVRSAEHHAERTPIRRTQRNTQAIVRPSGIAVQQHCPRLGWVTTIQRTTVNTGGLQQCAQARNFPSRGGSTELGDTVHCDSASTIVEAHDPVTVR